MTLAFPKQKKKRKKTSLNKELDTLWSKAVKVDGKCEYCGRESGLNAHHYFSRSIIPLRWNLDNGFCLCAGCHTLSSKMSAHKTPAEFCDWAREIRGLKWEADLRAIKNENYRLTDDDKKKIKETLENALTS